MVNMLLDDLQHKPDISATYPPRSTRDAEVCVEMPTHPSPTVDSPRRSAPDSAPSAPLGSQRTSETAALDEVPKENDGKLGSSSYDRCSI